MGATATHSTRLSLTMRATCLSLVFAACVVAMPAADDYMATAFVEYASAFNKTYSEAEAPARFEAFKSNVAKINANNAVEGAEVYGLTKFSDLTAAEFKQFLGYKQRTNDIDRAAVPVIEDSGDANATSVDWRTKGKVTPVKDQGQCGSCWAFSATEAVETAWLMAGKPQQILAPQQITSCDKVDMGCNGGDTPTAYKYVQKAGGMVLNKAYPYTSGKKGKTGKCIKADLKNKVVKITGFKYSTKPKPNEKNADAQKWQPGEDKMASVMSTGGPISVCVDAESWQNYKKGVVTKTCKQQLDHCVQAVGYVKKKKGGRGKGKSGSYWIVKNSWNTDWGNQGYIYVGMGGNYCGISNEATMATV